MQSKSQPIRKREGGTVRSKKKDKARNETKHYAKQLRNEVGAKRVFLMELRL